MGLGGNKNVGGMGSLGGGSGARSGTGGARVSTRTVKNAETRIANRKVSSVTKLGRSGKITPKQQANATRKMMNKNLKDVKTVLRNSRKKGKK